MKLEHSRSLQARLWRAIVDTMRMSHRKIVKVTASGSITFKLASFPNDSEQTARELAQFVNDSGVDYEEFT